MKTTLDKLRQRLQRSTLVAYGGWAALSLLLIAGTFTSLEKAESTEREAVLDRAEAGANEVEQVMLRVFEAVATLQNLAQARLRLGDQNNLTAVQTIEAQMRDIVDQNKFGIREVGVLGLEGALDWAAVPSGASALCGWPNINARVRTSTTIVISPPQIDPPPCQRSWVLHVTKTIMNTRGQVAAIAVISLDAAKLSDMIGRGKMVEGEASVVQLREDLTNPNRGTIIASAADDDVGLTLKVAKTDPVLLAADQLPVCLQAARRYPDPNRSPYEAAYQQSLSEVACHEYNDHLNGVDRLVGFGAPATVPVVVSRSYDSVKALREFYDLRGIVLTVVGALILGMFMATRLFLTNFLLRQTLGEQALRDPLTGLYNRRYFADVMSRKMAAATRLGDTAVVLLVDLDGFKQVNDTRGHPVGDGLLKLVADRLRTCVAANDTVIRLGGDEFAIVRLGRTQRRDVTALARYIVNELSETYEVDSYHLRISASVGVAMPPDGGEDLNDLLRSADIAMYFVKAESGAAYQLFDPAMENTVRTRRALEVDLREALGRRELEVYFQPLVQIDPHRVSGFEALLRWHHPTLGMVMPSRFIPVAEETGLITPIGEWVLHQACMEAANWPGRTRVAVNLSPLQFERSDIVDIVATALRDSHLDPERLELEITEGVVIGDSGDVLATMRRLRNLGVRLALDDFGTGYSSLSYLRSFPFDKVKIDGSFLADLAGDGGTIIRAVLGLCRHLDLDMLVEGVETEEQLDWLRREGCTEVQGHLFSPPRPASGVFEIINEVASRAGRRMPVEEELG